MYREYVVELWSNKEIMGWLKWINDGYFNNPQFRPLFDALKRMQLDGMSLKKMADTQLLKAFQLSTKECINLCTEIERLFPVEDRPSRDCIICVKRAIDTVFLPCTHMCVCHDCYMSKAHTFRSCPICRKVIQSVLEVKMSGLE